MPLIKQVLQNDCEATALAMVLAYSGDKVGQLALQKQVAHSPPLDPTVAADGSEVWGDPSRGVRRSRRRRRTGGRVRRV